LAAGRAEAVPRRWRGSVSLRLAIEDDRERDDCVGARCTLTTTSCACQQPFWSHLFTTENRKRGRERKRERERERKREREREREKERERKRERESVCVCACE
jgi:hypothetical protein